MTSPRIPGVETASSSALDTQSWVSHADQRSGRWMQHVAAWAQADVAAPSLDYRRAFGVSMVGNGPGGKPLFQITHFDGRCPGTVVDTRRQELAYLGQGEEAKAGASKSFFGSSKTLTASPDSARPVPVSLLAVRSPDDDSEQLLMLLQSGHLLVMHPVSLSVQNVIGIFAPLSPSPGLLLAALPRWAFVAMGPRLGVAPLDDGTTGGRDAKPIELPKGCVASAVLAFPSQDELVLVGCAQGQILLYASSVAAAKDAKKFSQLNLLLLHTFDVATAPRLSGSGSFMGRSRSRSASRPTSGSFSVAHLSALVPAADASAGFFVACGGGLQRGGGVASVWHLSLAGLRSLPPGKKGNASQFCKLAASGSTGKSLLRALQVPPSQACGLAPFVVLTLDSSGEVALFHSHGGFGSLQCLQTFTFGRGVDSGEDYPISAARTCDWTGSVHMLLGSGNREVAWLDVLALLANATPAIAPALHSCSRTSLSPLLGPTLPAPEQAIDVPHGGEVFFISQSALRCYSASTGQTASVPIRAAGDVRFLLRRVLGTIHSSSTGRASHVLVAVTLRSKQAGAGIESQAAVWVVSVAGAVVQNIAGAFDAAVLGETEGQATVVYLGSGGIDGRVVVGTAPATGGSTRLLTEVVGLMRVLRTPLGGSRIAMYWGANLAQSPLRLSKTSAGAADGSPSDVCPVLLPESPGSELSAAEWDTRQGHGDRGPWTVALASAHYIWVVRFQDASTGELVAWLDLRRMSSGVSRVLDLAWWRSMSHSSKLGGPLIISAPNSIMSWRPSTGSRAQVVVASDRPMLLAGVLLDRLLCVEVETKASVFGSAGINKDVTLGPRARVRTRPVNLVGIAAAPGRHATEAENMEAVQPVRNSDWRIVPLQIPHGLPQQLSHALWQCAVSPEAPPQLCLSAPSFHHLAVANSDEFRALASLVIKLQSALALRRKNNTSEADDEMQATQQVEESVRQVRSHPAWCDFAHAAPRLLLRCASQARSLNAASGLAVVSRGLARHDLLPFGALVAKVTRGLREGSQHPASWQPINADFAGMLQCYEGDARRVLANWTNSLLSPAPFAAALLHEVGTAKSRATGGPAFSAADLMSQKRSEPPPHYRALQSVQPGNHSVCTLHTATVAQWLGIGATKAQVKMIQSMLQKDSHGPEPAKDAEGPVGPLQARANGLLAYWRCADGNGSSVRDSGGCGRVARLVGSCEWIGPLAPRVPMEFTDEWDDKLAPNFAIALAAGGALVYSVRPQEEARDKEMLSLLGGSRASGSGVRHLQEASEREGEDLEFPAGWTVEFWLKLAPGATGELCLFSRAVSPDVQASTANLAWTYNRESSTFAVMCNGQRFLSGTVTPLAAGEWQHLALRSDLQSLAIWLNSATVATSDRRGVPQVPDGAILRFGPAAGAEFTEIRVWGVQRADDDLKEMQSQPLPTLADHERKADKWKKVKVRDAAEVEQPAAESFGGLNLLGLGIGGLDTTQASRRKGNQTAPKETALIDEEDDFHELLFSDADYDDVDLEDFRDELFNALRTLGLSEENLSKLRIDLRAGSIVAEVRGPRSVISELRSLPVHDMNVLGFGAKSLGGAPPPAAAFPAGGDAFGSGFGTGFGGGDPFGGDAFQWPVGDDPFASPKHGAFPTFDPQQDAGGFADPWAAQEQGSTGSWKPGDQWPAADHHEHHHDPFAATLANDGGDAELGREPSEGEDLGDDGPLPQLPPFGEEPTRVTSSRRSSLVSAGEVLPYGQQTRRSSMASVGSRRSVQFREAPPSQMGGSDYGDSIKVPVDPFAAGGGSHSSTPRSQLQPQRPQHSHAAPTATPQHQHHHHPTTRERAAEVQRELTARQRESAKPLEVDKKKLPPLERGASLTKALPPPQGPDGPAAAATDEAFSVAVVSMEARSYEMAAASFQGALELMRRQGKIGPGGIPRFSPVLRARVEAASAYTALSHLLRRCDGLRREVAARQSAGAAVDPRMIHALCQSWACALRLPKAPRHTAQYGVQAMATFYMYAQPVGGWVVAERLATILLQRCHNLLSEGEVEQVQYVKQATSVGRVARGMPPAMKICGECRQCGASLEPLLPHCPHCHAEVAVCFWELQLCDIRETAKCNVCSATVSHADEAPHRRWKPGGVGPTPIRSSQCPLCKMGILQHWRPRSNTEVLAY